MVTTSVMIGTPASGTFQPYDGCANLVFFAIFRPDRTQHPLVAGFSQTAGRSLPCRQTPSVVGRCHPLLASQADLPAKLMMRGSPRCLDCLPRQPGWLPLVTFSAFSSFSRKILFLSSEILQILQTQNRISVVIMLDIRNDLSSYPLHLITSCWCEAAPSGVAFPWGMLESARSLLWSLPMLPGVNHTPNQVSLPSIRQPNRERDTWRHKADAEARLRRIYGTWRNPSHIYQSLV